MQVHITSRRRHTDNTTEEQGLAGIEMGYISQRGEASFSIGVEVAAFGSIDSKLIVDLCTYRIVVKVNGA